MTIRFRKRLDRFGGLSVALFACSLLISACNYGASSANGQPYLLIASDEGNWPWSDIYVTSPVGSGWIHLSPGKDPSCSPDGRQVAYSAPVGGFLPDGGGPYRHIFVTSVEGFKVSQLTTNSEPGDIYNETPAWSPTGQQIAFRTRFTIALFNLQNQSLTYPIGKEWYMYDPAWAPDGRRLVAFGYLPKQQTGDGLYLIELNNGNLTRLTAGDDHSPDWSPDNRHIVFLHSDESGLPKSLRIIDADGSNPHDILPAVGGRSSPKWSPDSTRIAFVEHEDIGGQIGAAGVYTIAADGSDLTTVVAPGRQTWGRELSGLIPLPRTVRYIDLAWCMLRY